MTYLAPRSRVSLALPIHLNAGVGVPRLGAAFGFGDLASIATDFIGGIFGASTTADREAKSLKTQRQMQLDSLNATTEIARMQMTLGQGQIDAAVLTERIRAANEIRAIDSQYAALMSSQRVKKQIAQEALSTQLVAQTQSGLIGLARTGYEQSGSVSRTYPKMATVTLIALVGITAFAISKMKIGPSKSSSRKRRRFGRKNRRQAPVYYSNPSPTPSFSGAAA